MNIAIYIDYPFDLDVTVAIGHRRNKELIPEPKERPTLWKFEGGILPYQAIVVEWRQKPQGNLLAQDQVQPAA